MCVMCIIVFGIIPGPEDSAESILYILHRHTHFEYFVFNNNINIMYILLLFSLIAFVRTSFLFLRLLVFGARALTYGEGDTASC